MSRLNIFHWLEVKDGLICAETGACFYKQQYPVAGEDFNYNFGLGIVGVSGSRSFYGYDTEQARDLAWEGLKTKLGVLV